MQRSVRGRMKLEPNDLTEYQEMAWCRRSDDPPLSPEAKTTAVVRYASGIVEPLAQYFGALLQTRNTRSIKAPASTAAGSVPNAAGAPAHRRDARNASAEAAGPCVKNTDACTASAIISLKRLARSSTSCVESSSVESLAMKESKRASRPRAAVRVASSAARARGSRARARSTSRHMMLPDPSQIELSGVSRKRRAIGPSST